MTDSYLYVYYNLLGFVDKTPTPDNLKKVMYDKIAETRLANDHLTIFEAYFNVVEHGNLLAKLDDESLQLKQQIARIKNLEFTNQPEKKLLQQKFVQALTNLHHEIQDDLSHQINREFYCPEKKEAIINSPAATLRRTITRNLAQLTFSAENEKQEKMIFTTMQSQYQRKCEQNPGWDHFCGAIATICATGLAFIAGAVAGLLEGNSQFPVVGSLYALPAAFSMANDVREACYEKFNIPKGSIHHCLTFKTPLYETAREMTKTASELIQPCAKKLV